MAVRKPASLWVRVWELIKPGEAGPECSLSQVDPNRVSVVCVNEFIEIRFEMGFIDEAGGR